MQKVLIVGSARNDGDTARLTEKLREKSQWHVVDLNDYDINYYDYEHNNRNDDFLYMVRKLVEHYETLIFVTPVYWYSMSGVMKVFFDRFTDLLTIEKELGRQLRGKKMAAISCSAGDNLGDHFWLPFSHTANYLGMVYIGNLHTIAGKMNESEIDVLSISMKGIDPKSPIVPPCRF